MSCLDFLFSSDRTRTCLYPRQVSADKIHLNHFEILDLRPFEVRDAPGYGALKLISRKIVQDELRKIYPSIRNMLERIIESTLAAGLRSFSPFKTAYRLIEESLEELV